MTGPIAAPSVRLGVDVGGTFTDLVLVDDADGRVHVVKVPTTPRDPSLAVEAGVATALRAGGSAAAAVRSVIHGTTLVANTIIERTGESTALLTTRGFRDALEIGREHRYDMYDLLLELPKPLVPRNLRLEVDERILADGTVERPLACADVERLLRALVERGVRALAVSFLHSYRNPAHERQVAEIAARVAPDLRVSLSSDVAPEIKEYERTSTTVCNVYVTQLVDRYLEKLERGLRTLGVEGELYLMLSSGGLASVETGRRYPIRLLESGPAGGALAAARFGRSSGQPDLLSFDMGGTTAKLCIVEGGRPLTTAQSEVDRVYRFKRGSGLPVRISAVDMVEIGAGGGSIARVDALGLLRVGPDSAGADPGPACYGLGGTEPTVTDADLVLGYLDPAFFLGGSMALDVEAARAAIERRIARPMSLTVAEAAWGIHQIVNENMANAARVHAAERGRDCGSFPLFAFGGAGPVHAYGVGALLRSPSVIVPPAAGVGSAAGFLIAPLVFDFVRTSIGPLAGLDSGRVDGLLREMEDEGVRLLARSGVAADEIEVVRTADLRYVGQGHEVNVALPDGAADEAAVVSSFERTYRRIYNRTAPDVAIEAVNWRVAVKGPTPALEPRPAPRRSTAATALKGERPAFFRDRGEYLPTPVFDRYGLSPGAVVDGPAIVEEIESTVVVGPGGRARVDDHLNLTLTR